MSVSPDLHERVLRRDGMCFLAKESSVALFGQHQCKDQWGVNHSAYDLRRLTVDHVHHIPGGIRGKRAPDEEFNLVSLCAKANIDGPSREIRQAERAYLQQLYPEDFE